MSGDNLILNLTCSSDARGPGRAERLPERLPDGSRIKNNQKLTSRLFKTHEPATRSGNVFIPKHKLPCLDEFGLTRPKDVVDRTFKIRDEDRIIGSSNNKRKYSGEGNIIGSSIGQPTSKKHDNNNNKQPASIKKDKDNDDGKQPVPKNRDNRLSIPPQTGRKAQNYQKIDQKGRFPKMLPETDKRMIIPEEVKAVAGGLPPSFPKKLLKKYSEPRLLDAGREPSPDRKKRRTFVPGLNPRRKEKSPNLFVDTTIEQIKGLHPYLVSSLQQNYEIIQLTKIQHMTIPKLLAAKDDKQGLDIIINSQIGSGKTLSYIVPVINTLATIEPKISRTDGVHALILLPTREQAALVNEVFVKLCRSFTWVVPGLLVGGERKKSEKARIRKGLNILITTPGRLIDHIQHTHKLEFSKVKYFILADAHKLLDPERIDAAHEIVAIMRKKLTKSCIKCLVTATITKKIEKLSDMILKKPITLDAFEHFE